MKLNQILLIFFAIIKFNISIDDCYIDINDEFCITCVDEYGLEENGQCSACTSEEIWYKNGYTSHGDNCFKKIEHCKKYEEEKETCSRCEEGYEFYQNGLKCIEECESDSQIKPFDECIDRIENCEIL